MKTFIPDGARATLAVTLLFFMTMATIMALLDSPSPTWIFIGKIMASVHLLLGMRFLCELSFKFGGYLSDKWLN